MTSQKRKTGAARNSSDGIGEVVSGFGTPETAYYSLSKSRKVASRWSIQYKQ